ncbi:opticin isoform X2 [Amia ocellicauda]
MTSILRYLPLTLSLLGGCLCAPPGNVGLDSLNLENYDLTEETDWETIHLLYTYDDLESKIEVGTVAPPSTAPLANRKTTPHKTPPPALEEEVPLRPRPTQVPTRLDFGGPGLFGPQTGMGLPTCLLCVCIGTSVYCDDADLEDVPPLPKDTTYFYGRFNKITGVRDTDFAHLKKLKHIDLTGNQIAEMGEDALRTLPTLEELLLPENRLWRLPELPPTLRRIDVRHNRLISTGMRPEAFKDMIRLEFLYLSHNYLDFVPAPLPDSLRVLNLQNNNIQSLSENTFCNQHDPSYIRRALEDIRLDGNPINLSHFPGAYGCLPRLPTGRTR